MVILYLINIMYGHVPMIMNEEMNKGIEENLKCIIEKRTFDYLPAKITQIKAHLWEDDITDILQDGKIKLSEWELAVIESNEILIDEILKEADLTYDKSEIDILKMVNYASNFRAKLRKEGYIQEIIRNKIDIVQLEQEVEEEKSEIKKIPSLNDDNLWFNPYKILTFSLERLIMANKDSTYLIKEGMSKVASSPIIAIINEYCKNMSRDAPIEKHNEFVNAAISYVKNEMLVEDDISSETMYNIAAFFLEGSVYYLDKRYSGEWTTKLMNKLVELYTNKKIVSMRNEVKTSMSLQ